MKVTDAIKIAKNKGLNWVLFRTNYELRKRTGIMKKKFPTMELTDDDLIDKILDEDMKSKAKLVDKIKSDRSKFFFESENCNEYNQYLVQNLNEKEKDDLIRIADEAINGNILCFSKWKSNYGYPINWHINPATNYEWTKDEHWVDIEEFSKDSGDVKYVWEASRFPQFYYFIRAYILTNNEKYVKAYWDQINSWNTQNPYNIGINWKCGQEVTFRMFAWIFGLYVFLDSPHSTNERIFTLIKNLYQSVIRIEDNIEFAIKAVQNNHSISESAGLFTFGVLFPYFKDSDRLINKGIRFLEKEGLKQIYDDGSYIQNSMNYHRLMLQDYAWCYRLAEKNNITFSLKLTEKINKAINFLYQMQNEQTGRLPNYGANDGALIFPLTSCDYLDYRPQLNTINYIVNGVRLYQQGKYDEELLWFCGLGAMKSNLINTTIRESKGFKIGGYYTFRNDNSFGMIKCGSSKNRQGTADMLHFDFWYKGTNVLCDTGSYSYNTVDKFKNYFRATENHNTITINDKDQTKRGPRFLIIDWPNGYLNKYKKANAEISFSGYHDAYENTHTRDIQFLEDSCVIKDTIKNSDQESITINLNWNIGTNIEKIDENKYRLRIDDKESVTFEISSLTKGNLHLYYANEDKPAGWRSLYYGEKVPVNQLVYEVESKEEKEEVIITKILIEK